MKWKKNGRNTTGSQAQICANQRPMRSSELSLFTLEKWVGWLRFISLPYFRRVWMVQEVLQPKKLYLVTAGAMIPWEDFARAVCFTEAVRAWPGDTIARRALLGVDGGDSDCSDISSDDDDVATSVLPVLMSSAGFGLKRHADLVTSRNKFGRTTEMGLRGVELDVLLERHRGTEAGDPRDKVYALLGVVAESQTTLRGQPLGKLEIDYRASVEMVYTRAGRHLCHLFQDLRILHHREPNSKRQLKYLPSWVPGFSSKHLGGALKLGAGGGDSWIASGNGTSWIPDTKQLPEDPELVVRGRLLGTVKDVVSCDMDHKRRIQTWQNIIRLCLAVRSFSGVKDHSLGPLESSMPSVLEHLARTLTRDTLQGMSPAPGAELAIQCLNHAIEQYFKSLGYDKPAADEESCDADPQWAKNLRARYRGLQEMHSSSSEVIRYGGTSSHDIDDMLSTLTGREHENSLFSREVFMNQLATHIKYKTRENAVYRATHIRGPATMGKTEEIHFPELRDGDFYSQVQLSVADRAVFVTAGGETLGLGPGDARPDDQVWVLDGANTPVVLHQHSRGMGAVRYYEFLGEAYVHGMMHGEAAERFPDVQELVLI
ncbi:hypothetical protein V8F33_000783 [Rhypophila sp. PSN 637]